MALEILIVEDKFELPNGKLAITLYTPRKELRFQWREINPSDLKVQFANKTIRVTGENLQFETNVLDVEIMNSTSDFKTVGLLLENNAFTGNIQRKDQVEVDLD